MEAQARSKQRIRPYSKWWIKHMRMSPGQPMAVRLIRAIFRTEGYKANAK